MNRLLSIAALTGAALTMFAGASLAATPSSSSADSCGPNTMMCVRGTVPQCTDGAWHCVTPATGYSSSISSSSMFSSSYSSVSSSSSTSDLPCGPLTMMCMVGTIPQCNGSQWQCVPISSSSSSRTSSSSSQSSSPNTSCGPNNVRCMIGTVPMCTNGHWQCVSQTTQQSPSISSLKPNHGPTGTRVIIWGTNFARKGNIIHFADDSIMNVRSRLNGTALVFRVPQESSPYCPPGMFCPLYIREYIPGDYQVSVETPKGTSNSLTYTITATR